MPGVFLLFRQIIQLDRTTLNALLGNVQTLIGPVIQRVLCEVEIDQSLQLVHLLFADCELADILNRDVIVERRKSVGVLEECLCRLQFRTERLRKQSQSVKSGAMAMISPL